MSQLDPILKKMTRKHGRVAVDINIIYLFASSYYF